MFCRYCGNKVEDGQVCPCQQPAPEVVEQPVVAVAEEPVTEVEPVESVEEIMAEMQPVVEEPPVVEPAMPVEPPVAAAAAAPAVGFTPMTPAATATAVQEPPIRPVYSAQAMPARDYVAAQPAQPPFYGYPVQKQPSRVSALAWVIMGLALAVVGGYFLPISAGGNFFRFLIPVEYFDVEWGRAVNGIVFYLLPVVLILLFTAAMKARARALSTFWIAGAVFMQLFSNFLQAEFEVDGLEYGFYIVTAIWFIIALLALVDCITVKTAAKTAAVPAYAQSARCPRCATVNAPGSGHCSACGMALR